MRAALLCSAIVATLAVSSTARAGVHPRVVFEAKDLPALRAKLAGPMKPIGDALAGAVNDVFDGGGVPAKPDLAAWSALDDRRAIADTLLAFAFEDLMSRDGSDAQTAARAKQVAHDYLVGICNYSDWVFAADQGESTPDLYLAHMMFDVTLAYDWMGDELSEAERTTCLDRVATESAKMYAVGKIPDGGAWWIPEYLQNHHWINNVALGMVALGFEGELGGVDTKPWYDNTIAALDEAKMVIDPIAGGAWHEGIGYADYGMDSLVWFGIANGRLKSGTDYADVGLVHDYSYMRMFGMPPAQPHRREYVVYGDWSGYQDEGAIEFFEYQVAKKKDAHIAWYAQQFTAGAEMGRDGYSTWPPSLRGPIAAVILHDDSVTPTAPAGLGAAWALDFFASDLSLFTARSGWDDGGALLGFKTGVFGGHWNWDRLKSGGAPGGNLDFGHDHADDMNIWLFADGEWLTTNVPGYWIGQSNGWPEANRTKYANSLLIDGNGQLGEGPRSDSFDAPTNAWFFERTSSIPFRGSTAHFAYALGAGSKLYDAKLGLDAWGRAILFVDRRLALVRDTVHAAASHRFDVVWHALDAVETDGSWLKLHAKNDRVLGIDVLAPAPFASATEVQSGLEHEDGFDADDAMTAVMIHPATNAAAANFLQALVPARGATWSSKPTITSIDATAADRGATIVDGPSTIDVVFTDDPSQTQTAKNVAPTGLAGVREATGGKTTRAVLACGSALTLDGTKWIEVLDGAPASVEVEPTPTGVSVSGDGKKLRVYAPGATTVSWNGAAVDFDRDGDFVVLPKSGSTLGDAGPDASGVDGGASDGGTNGEQPGGGASNGGCGCATQPAAPMDALFALLALAALAVARYIRALSPRRPG